MCPFDTGLIEANKRLYFSGYIKPVYDEDSSPENGIPAHDMGPLNEWYVNVVQSTILYVHFFVFKFSKTILHLKVRI